MPAAEPSTPRNILMVCFGNLCRSPMAEALMRERLPDDWVVRSAGTHALGGDPPTATAQQVIADLTGLDISAQRSSLLTTELLNDSEHVFVMTRRQGLDAVALCPAAADRTRLLGAFVPATGWLGGIADPFGKPAGAQEIADPMGGDPEAYRACCERLTETIGAAAEWLIAGADPDKAPPPVERWKLRGSRR